VDEALELVGETTISIAAGGSKNPEPIPESQEDINKQADGAIRDLFPRIPNTDRQMIIEHAFQKVIPASLVPSIFTDYHRVLCFTVSQLLASSLISICLAEFSLRFSLTLGIHIRDTISS
jgi:hypothetical protein